MMLLPPALITFFLVISIGRCQFVYNYEQDDADDPPNKTDETEEYQYNPPAAVNERFHRKRGEDRAVPSEAQNAGTRRSSTRTSPSPPEIQPPSQYIEESETPRNEQAQGPRKRKYRRIFREGTYIEPPTQSPRVYSPSIFENIRLGQAPSGVYVPQDSFLNVLNNPSFRQGAAASQTSIPQNIMPYNGNYEHSISQEPRFFVQPPSSEEVRVQRNVISPIVQPRVVYGSTSSMPTTDTIREIPIRRESQGTRQRRQRQPTHSDIPPEPLVDIDALRIYPNPVRENTPSVPQVRKVIQPSPARNFQRQITPLRNNQDFSQTPRVYSPSVFQNIGLGESPSGVHIPQDSLLNVLRSSPSSARLPSRNVAENPQPSSEISDSTYMEDQNYIQPEISDQLVHSSPDTTRRSRQRSRSENTSGRTVRRRTQYRSSSEEQEPVQTVPASSQQERRHRTQDSNTRENQRQRTDLPDRRSSQRQQMRTEPKPSQTSSTGRQQRNFKPAKLAIAALPEDTDDDGIPGEAGVNYPTLHTIPRTTFSCAQQEHKGYYADLETSCQVVHLCQARGAQNSFLCPNGTIFSQEKFACQWWYTVNCAESPKFYSINDSLYKIPEKKKN